MPTKFIPLEHNSKNKNYDAIAESILTCGQSLGAQKHEKVRIEMVFLRRSSRISGTGHVRNERGGEIKPVNDAYN